MTLPGMPIRAGDPGVFVCGPEDVAPWGNVRPLRKPVRAGAGDEQKRAPRPPARVWLVMRICPACGPGYCPEHNERNWWLENFRPPSR